MNQDFAEEIGRIASAMTLPAKTRRLELAERECAQLIGQQDALRKREIEILYAQNVDGSYKHGAGALQQVTTEIEEIRARLSAARAQRRKAMDHYGLEILKQMTQPSAAIEHILKDLVAAMEAALKPTGDLAFHAATNQIATTKIIEKSPHLRQLVEQMRIVVGPAQ
jgi:hypothetical protein